MLRFRPPILGVIFLTVVLAGELRAQDPVLTVQCPPTPTFTEVLEVPVTLEFSGAEPTSQWSLGVCNDPSYLICIDTELGSATATANGGSAPGFVSVAVYPEGYTQGIVVDFFGTFGLDPGAEYELSLGYYELAGSEVAGITSIEPCSTLGPGPVPTSITFGGQPVTPTQVGCEFEVVPIPDPTFTFIAPTVSATNFPATDGIGGLTVSAEFSIAEADQSGAGLPFPSDTQGFSMAVESDPALVTPVAVNPAGEVAGLNGGSGPDFFQVGLFADAWSCGVVYNLLGGVFTQFDTGGEGVISVDYQGVAGALAGVEGTTNTPLTWSTSVGTPPVALVVVVGGASYAADLVDGSITFLAISDPGFERGDCNADGAVDIADVVYDLQMQFSGYPALCPIACDANADGVLDIADPIFLASYIFLGGPPPPAPFGTCDLVPGQTPEDCSISGCTQ